MHKHKHEIESVIEDCTCPLGGGKPHRHIKLKHDAGTYAQTSKAPIVNYSRDYFPNARAIERDYQGKIMPD